MPKPFAFVPGVEYLLKGIGYRVLKVLSEDQVLVKNLMTKGEVAQKIGDLRREWHEYHLAFGLHGRNLREEEGSSVKTSYEFGDIDFLDPDLAQETWDRYQLILPLLGLHSQKRTDGKIEQHIEKFVAEQLLLIASGERTRAVFPQRSGKKEKSRSLKRAVKISVVWYLNIATAEDTEYSYHPMWPHCWTRPSRKSTRQSCVLP